MTPPRVTVGDHLQVEILGMHLDAAHRSEDCAAHVVVDDEGFGACDHDRSEHADRQLDHVGAGVGGEAVAPRQH